MIGERDVALPADEERADRTLVDLVRRQAARSPHAVAVEYEAEQLTYAQLDARANRLGAYLKARGVGPEVLVGLCVERSIAMLVAVLGVHRAGGAYVPLDPSYPPDRLAFMVSDSGLSLVVSEEELRARLPDTIPLVSLDGERAAIAAMPATFAAVALQPQNLAYAIYTSGSTGRPKGVAVEHRSVVNVVEGMQRLLGLKRGERFVAVAPLGFDISNAEIYATLGSGARLILARRETASSPRALAALLERSGATHVQATPSLWRMMLESGWQGHSGLTLLCAGEALPQLMAEKLVARTAAVWNLYGPTETTIYATAERVMTGRQVTIGRPMSGVRTYVLDAGMQRVRDGASGELCIGGDGVARGYLNRPELTAQRFVPDPFSEVPGARMYRTGDVARVLPEGALEFLGRSDFQVKVRGHRIELGEIETTLEERPDIRAAVVVVREETPGDPMLAAYVTVEPGAAFASEAVRRDLATRLAPQMVPDVVVVLDTLPLTNNGKIDRAVLPAPVRTVTAAGRPGFLPPRTRLEARLAAIWEDVLNVRPVGMRDDFFELGASSIAAARLFERIERELGTKLPLSPLFTAPTIEKLAVLIESGNGSGSRATTSLVPIQPLGTKTPIFCVHGGTGAILHLQPLAKYLGLDQPFYGLQARGLYGEAAPHLTVDGMARHYLRELRHVQPAGPYVLAGFCFGGDVAHAMARQLEAAGETVALLVMFNAASPGYLQRLAKEDERRRRERRRQDGVGEWSPRQLRRRLNARRRLMLLRSKLCGAFGFPLAAAWRERAFRDLSASASRHYRPQRVRGPMLIITGHGLFDEPFLGWDPFVEGDIALYELPGTHDDERDAVREPHVAAVAARLREQLQRSSPVR